MKVAIAQLSISVDKLSNLEKATNYIVKAKEMDADVVILPEFYLALATPSSGILPGDIAESLDGPFITCIAEAARENKIYVICGTLETNNNRKCAYNTTVFIDRYGQILHTYRKPHLFDTLNEKFDTIISRENQFQVVNTEFGNIGLMACYELRFPEIARRLVMQEADILFVPAGWFAGALKEAHWEILIRARAIENTVFVCGSNLVGNVFFGRSMIVDPMGVITASGGEEETLIISNIDLKRIHRVRGKTP